ncbi:MAG: RecX family transcriptional regulator [Bdellovibrionales bacterium]|nr:RecX family transcriptional regulator [Bdellovibrionales bacterium]
MGLIAKRDHSRKELREKLKRAEHTQDEIEAALAEAEDRRWLPSENELAHREAARLSRGGKSTQQIRQWLMKKGLPTAAAASGETDETAAAAKMAEKAWARLLRSAEKDHKKDPRRSLESAMRLRVVRQLVGRGFSSQTAQAVYARLLKENPLK